jgi:hypothetical protein
MIALQEPDPSVAAVFQDAQANGTITWLRWETINGKPAAVFAFQVPKKKSHFAVNVCCFPSLDQTGDARFSGQNGAGLPGGSQGGAGGQGHPRPTPSGTTTKPTAFPTTACSSSTRTRESWCA